LDPDKRVAPATDKTGPAASSAVSAQGVIIDPESDHGELDLAVPAFQAEAGESAWPRQRWALAPSVPSVCQMPELHCCWMFLQRHGDEVKSDQVQFSSV